MLEEIAREVRAGVPHDEAWELFRVQHFPGKAQEAAAAALGAWARKHGIEPVFYTEDILAGKRPTKRIRVLLTAR